MLSRRGSGLRRGGEGSWKARQAAGPVCTLVMRAGGSASTGFVHFSSVLLETPETTVLLFPFSPSVNSLQPLTVPERTATDTET